ncbi:MAG: Ig-like domain-containing protein [Bacteroidales bacterium]|jgi:hypothetical protein|nr:Ig-like domain-containing protein [Bacteroidales bacterium]
MTQNKQITIYFYNFFIQLCKKKCKIEWQWGMVVISGLFFASCASIGTLTGGDKDVTPPQILSQEPDNQSIEFNSPQIKLTFDEYIELDNPMDNFLISPPLKDMPTYTIKGKSLIIKLNNSLDSNTTYIITASGAIKDLTEGNLLPITQWVFSTGQYIDSLSITGYLKDAITLEPIANAGVMLHKNATDSALMIQMPDYYTVTDEKGHFVFHYLADHEYALSALVEKSRNYLFDQKDEKVAFCSKSVRPYYLPPPDTTAISLDSNISQKEIQIIENQNDTMYLFAQEDTVFRFLKRELKAEFTHSFSFHGKVDSFKLQQISDLDTLVGYLVQTNTSQDTVTVYFTRPIVPHRVDFELIVNSQIMDTLTINLMEKLAGTRHSKSDTTVKRLNFQDKCNTELNILPSIVFFYPVDSADLEHFILIEKTKKTSDTLPLKVYFADSNLRILQFDYPFKEQANYSIFCPDSMFCSYHGHFNDSIKITFSTKSAKDYGTLKVNYHFFEEKHYILELLSENMQVLQQDFCTFDKSITYSYLKPAKYKLRVIADNNNNKKWDSGHYLSRQQPEKIIYFEKIIEILPNWKIEEEFEVNF